MNEFILSDKYIDFLKYDDADSEFLEGTTFAGKTTIGVPKFMFKVSRSQKKFHVLSGLDLGTIEKNIIQKDNGVVATFGGLVDYKGSGDVNYSMPHIKFKTETEEKIIFVVGYDNKARWKKILGGQYGCLYIDEFNIADMDFVREIWMRCDYRIATLNPDDPNLDCYKQYVNCSRPLEKYKDDAPLELLKMLNEEAKDKWVWWYFSFEHNASLSEEKKQQIIDSVPKGTKLYKNKILGLRGKATGLVFDLQKENVISREEALSFEYIEYAIGCDTSYSKKTHDKLTFELIGITKDNKCVILEEETNNNKDKSQLFAPSDVLPMLNNFANKCCTLWNINKALDIFIDSADAGTLAEADKYKRKTHTAHNFYPAWKKTINIVRVQLQRSWMKTHDFFIVDECIDYLAEMDIYSYTETGELEDANDHSIQGGQYGWLPYKSKIGNWELLKKIVNDTSKETLDYDPRIGR